MLLREITEDIEQLGKALLVSFGPAGLDMIKLKSGLAMINLHFVF